MPERLSIRLTVLLAAGAFAQTFAILALLGGGSSAAEPAGAERGASRAVADASGAEPDLRLASAASVPPLREPRRARKRAVRKKKAPAPRVVKPVPQTRRLAPRPTATVAPAPTSTPPRYVPPPPRSTPAPRPRPVAPKPKPAPTAPPPSGDFDTTGDGGFDSSGP